MKLELKKIIIGVRYNRSFKLKSIFGDMIDFCLENFIDLNLEKVLGSDQDFILKSGDNKNYINCNIDNFVLSIESDKYNRDFIEKNISIIKKVFGKFLIKNTNRIGIIREYSVLEGDISEYENILKQYEPNSVDIRFSKKLDKRNSAFDLKLEDTDYNQVIINYVSDKEKNISIDYQSYFIPEISVFEDVNVSEFLDSMENYNNGKLELWQK